MIDFVEVDKSLFLQRKKDGYYKLVLGGDFNRCEKAYEIILSSKEKIGAMLLNQNIPKVTLWKNKLCILVNNELHIFSFDGILIQTFITPIDIQEYVFLKNKLIVIGEIEVLLIEETFEKVYIIHFDGIITQYYFSQDCLICQIDTGEFKTINLDN